MSIQPLVALLTPHAGVWPHALAELPLMNALVNNDARVIALTCDGILAPQCTVMYSRGVNADSPQLVRKAVCVDCRSADRDRRTVEGVEWISLRTFLESDDLAEVESICNAMTPDEVSSMIIDDIPIGTTSAYETLLHAKARPLDALRSSWTTYMNDLRGALLCLTAFQRMLEHEDVETVIVYNGLYSSNRAVWESAFRVGVRALDIHATSHPTLGYEYLCVERTLRPRFQDRAADEWIQWRDIPLTEEEVRFAHQYLEAGILSRAPWSYSRARSNAAGTEVLNRLGLSPTAPTVVVLLNSLDERIAATFVGVNVDSAWPLDQPTPLDNFIDTTLAIARQRPDWQFVIRVHPRMAPNKRDGVTSPELATLQQRLASTPGNVAVDWPDMGLSLFDVALITDCALSIGTTAGLQMMGLGIPTVLCNRSQEWTFARDLYVPTTGEDSSAIEDAIESALESERSLSGVSFVYRFIVYKHLRSAFRVLESPRSDHTTDGYSGDSQRQSRKNALVRFGRLLVMKDRIGLLSAPAIVFRSWLSKRTRRWQAQSAVRSRLDLEPLSNAVLRNGVDSHVPTRAQRSSADSPNLLGVESTQIRRSLVSLYALLGVPVPNWVTEASSEEDCFGD